MTPADSTARTYDICNWRLTTMEHILNLLDKELAEHPEKYTDDEVGVMNATTFLLEELLTPDRMRKVRDELPNTSPLLSLPLQQQLRSVGSAQIALPMMLMLHESPMTPKALAQTISSIIGTAALALMSDELMYGQALDIYCRKSAGG